MRATILSSFLAFLAVLLWLSPSPVLAMGPEVMTQNGISYLSGGIGLGERQQLETMSSQFNVKFVFAMSTGEYLSDVKLSIESADGKPMLNAESNGPWFYAQLPKGSYKAVAEIDGVKQQRVFTVNRFQTIQFRWPAKLDKS